MVMGMAGNVQVTNISDETNDFGFNNHFTLVSSLQTMQQQHSMYMADSTDNLIVMSDSPIHSTEQMLDGEPIIELDDLSHLQ